MNGWLPVEEDGVIVRFVWCEDEATRGVDTLTLLSMLLEDGNPESAHDHAHESGNDE